MAIISGELGRAAWRRLLQLDLPAPKRSKSEIAAEVERNYSWNYAVNLLDVATFMIGINFVSATTILPLYVSKLTDNALLIGLIAVLAQAGWLLPQIFTAGFIEKLDRKKPVVVNLGFFTERVPVWLWPLSALMALFSPTLALILFFLGYGCHMLGAGAVAPAWQDLIARCFPVKRRGRFFGTATFVGTGVGAVGAAFSGWLLALYDFPINFAIVFLIGALAITISWFFLSLTKEPVQPVDHTAQPAQPIWSKLGHIIRQDDNFRHYLQARLLSTMGTMGLGFVTVAAIQRLQVSDSIVGFYTAALLLGQTAGSLAAGWLADRYGHKLSLEVAVLATIIGFAIALMTPPTSWYFLIFFFLGIGTGATIVSGLLISLEFSAPEQRPTYVGVANTVVGVGSVVAPLVGGWLALYSYTGVFALSVIFGIAALLFMHWFVVDPRWQSDNESP